MGSEAMPAPSAAARLARSTLARKHIHIRAEIEATRRRRAPAMTRRFDSVFRFAGIMPMEGKFRPQGKTRRGLC